MCLLHYPSTEAECLGRPRSPELPRDAVFFSRRRHALWRGRPRASHRFHGNGLLDAVPILGQLRQSGALEVLHQPQMPCPHDNCR